MRVTYGILRLEVPQRAGLGRHLELDSRSLAYAVEEAPLIKPAEWLAPLPTLDQGQLGSCVGNATTRHLAQLYGADSGSLRLGSFELGPDPVADEQFAIHVYHLATVADGFPGTYPPDDTGSSGLGACRAMKKAKVITSYHWALSGRGLATLLQHGSAIIGLPWYNSWFDPDSGGFIDAGDWQRSGLAGGHELYLEAIEQWDNTDPANCVIRFHNSWGSSWADHGCGRFRMSTYEALKSQIDVKQMVR